MIKEHETITQCKYISILGFMNVFDTKRNYNIFNNNNNFNDIKNGKEGDTIYVFLDKNQFNIFLNVLPSVTYKFILVVQEGDETFPNDLITPDQFLNLMNNPYLIKCYSSNCNYTDNYHPKLNLLPIGLNYHVFNNPWLQEQQLEMVKQNTEHFCKRKIMCYGSFHFNMDNRGYIHRIKAINEIPKDLVYYEEHRVDRIKTWEKQIQYAFVISPIGNGLDCFRTWEALILGCIVIVEKSPLDNLYIDLPVLIVDNYKDITKELLIETVEKFKIMSFKYEKLHIEYWKNIICTI
jgi:hypothetical protein